MDSVATDCRSFYFQEQESNVDITRFVAALQTSYEFRRVLGGLDEHLSAATADMQPPDLLTDS